MNWLKKLFGIGKAETAADTHPEMFIPISQLGRVFDKSANGQYQSNTKSTTYVDYERHDSSPVIDTTPIWNSYDSSSYSSFDSGSSTDSVSSSTDFGGGDGGGGGATGEW